MCINKNVCVENISHHMKRGSKGYKNVLPILLHSTPNPLFSLPHPLLQLSRLRNPRWHFTARFLALTLCVNMKKCHFIATMRRNFVKIYCAYAALYNKYALKCPPARCECVCVRLCLLRAVAIVDRGWLKAMPTAATRRAEIVNCEPHLENKRN